MIRLNDKKFRRDVSAYVEELRARHEASRRDVRDVEEILDELASLDLSEWEAGLVARIIRKAREGEFDADSYVKLLKKDDADFEMLSLLRELRKATERSSIDWERYEEGILNEYRYDLKKVFGMLKKAMRVAGIDEVEVAPEFYVSPDGRSSITYSVGFGDATFTLFPDGTVDDVLDAGDREFFRDPEVERNYFALVNAIRNPRLLEKVVTLYTSRPRKDREKLLRLAKRRKWPHGIFLTSDVDRAEGFGREFRDRDLWKVKVKLKNLVKTLDAGRIKDYQLIGDGRFAEIESASLM